MNGGSDGDDLTVRGEVLDRLREVVLAAEEFRGSIASQEGFRVVESQALSHLAAAGPIGQGELSHHLGLSAAAMTGLVDRLTDAGVLRREPHPTDRRRSVIHLTDAGFALMRRSRRYFAHALDTIEDAQLDEAAKLFALVAQNLREQADLLSRADGPAGDLDVLPGDPVDQGLDESPEQTEGLAAS